MCEHGIDVEFMKKIFANGEEDKVRYDEIEAEHGYRGLCEAIRLIPWLDYTPVFAFTSCHNLLD
jgi:hypothetical protein